jgi:putative flippase GtrA
MKNFVLHIIRFFYPPFRGIMNERLFRYAFCGAAANAFDILIYFISYNFILQKQNVDAGFFTFSPHVASILIAFCFSFPVGFLLQKYITFTSSNMRGRVQLFRYFTIVAVCIAMNIFFIKLFVERMGIYPTVSKVLVTVIVVLFSYFAQRNYSFREDDAAPIRMNIKKLRDRLGR